MNINRDDLSKLPQRYRANLINGVAGFKPVNLIGTADAQGHGNLAIFSSVFHLGASPGLLGMIIRPAPSGTERHTLDNINNNQHFTINSVAPDIMAKAHQTSARYPQTVSEFEAVGLTPLWQSNFPAPFVTESAIQLGMIVRQITPIALNDTTMVIGEIAHLAIADEWIAEDGSVDLYSAGAIVATGLDRYHQVDTGQRYAYAKPKQVPKKLD